MLDEPEGWQELQQRAKRIRNPQKLIEIIYEMNALLTRHEKKVAERQQYHQMQFYRHDCPPKTVN